MLTSPEKCVPSDQRVPAKYFYLTRPSSPGGVGVDPTPVLPVLSSPTATLAQWVANGPGTTLARIPSQCVGGWILKLQTV